ncbi:MAG: HlyD family efflux transporter periplasmic adaptor subunit [Deltaproteobacteria bacterium]|nr:HlyD family efflux transporter periplasmic adaptor subunit [Deltaproteobacteria bacterium]
MSAAPPRGTHPVFREEALAALRAPARPGAPLSVGHSTGIAVVAVVVGLLVAVVAAAAIVSSPEYVAGRAVIQFDGVRFARTPRAGAVDEVLVEPGQWVERGDPIARMDSSAATRVHVRARREYDDAVRAMLRAPSSVAARTEVGQRARVMRRAHADQLASEIRAPVSGRVQAVRVRPGQTAAASQVVCTISDQDGQARVLALVPGNARPSLDPGASLRLTLDEHPRTTVELAVHSISNGLLSPDDVDQLGAAHVGVGEGVSVAVRASMPATIDDGRDGTLQIFDGMTASVEIVVRERSLLERVLGDDVR